ncbi:hypothetical protein J6590_101016 [Homalodisca vitripennis]|nr:hypothetical protein J6590_101016 [Homalodisca vitripennis]
MNRFTFEEYADIHFVYGLAGGNARLASRLYRERFPDRLHPVHSVFSAVHIRLRETGHLKNNVEREVEVVVTRYECIVTERVRQHYFGDMKMYIELPHDTIIHSMGAQRWRVSSVSSMAAGKTRRGAILRHRRP